MPEHRLPKQVHGRAQDLFYRYSYGLYSYGRGTGFLSRYMAALKIREAMPGPQCKAIAEVQNNIGVCYWRQGRLDEALPGI